MLKRKQAASMLKITILDAILRKSLNNGWRNRDMINKPKGKDITDSGNDEPISELTTKSQETAELVWKKQLAPFVNQTSKLLASMQPIADLQLKIQRSIAPALAAWQNTFVNIAPLTQALTKWQQDIAPILQRITPALAQFGKFGEIWGKWLEEQKEIADAFKSGHLLLAPSMPIDLVREVKTICQAGDYRRASAVISGYYRRNGYHNLEYMVSQWTSNKYFYRRNKIISDCLEAHKQGKYTLTVPVLLSQVEGIASDAIINIDASKLGGIKPKLGKTKSVVLGITRETNRPLRNAIQETLIAFVNEPLYKTRDFENDYGVIKKFTGLSRHSILHGIQTRYNNHTNSLRLFFVIDILFFTIESLEQVTE